MVRGWPITSVRRKRPTQLHFACTWAYLLHMGDIKRIIFLVSTIIWSTQKSVAE